MTDVRALFLLCGALLVACSPASTPPTASAPPPPAADVPAAKQPAAKSVAPNVAHADASPATAPKAAPAAASKPAAAPASAPKPAPAASAAKPAPAASAPKPAPAAPAPAAPAPKPAPLDLKALEQRLKDTGAIGVLTKLSLKNQVDDLVSRFRAYHAGSRPPTLPELRPAFELLLMKALSLLQDKDPALAKDIDASRESIWGVLSDRNKFAQYTT